MEETLGKRIAFHRKRLSMTQDALAEQLGVTAQAVSKWENDQSCPDITMLPRLAAVFDITTDELLGVARKEIRLAETIPEELPEAPVLKPEEQTEDIPDDSSFRANAGKYRSVSIALWLLLSGVLVFFNSFHTVHLSVFDCMIASGIFVFGLYSLLSRVTLFRLVCTAAGAYFMLHIITDTSLGGIDWGNVFAIGLMLLGLNMLVNTLLDRKNQVPPGHKFNGSSKNYCTCDGERFECVTCFGEGNRKIQLARLSGGRGELAFGELNIDLTPCAEIADGCSIALECTFGSLELLVPRNYRVETDSRAAFGSVEETGTASPDANCTVYLNCKVSFGEIRIRHV